MDWFRMYGEFATDPKVQMMPEAMQRRLVMLLCLQCSNGIETFHETERDSSIAFALRISDAELAATKELFMRKEFINSDWTLRNWDKRQYASDSSTARVRRHREKSKQAGETHETFQERSSNGLEQNRTDTEQIKEHPPTPRKRGKKDSDELVASDLEAMGIPPTVAADYIALRHKKRTTVTKTVIEGVMREAEAVGMDLETALRTQIERGWQGFKAGWLQNQARASPSRQTHSQRIADWNAELRDVLTEGHRPMEIDMGVIDASH
ncbi:hypothetical protein [Achromobacter xylosoxidans]|uniref:DUF1376 domain-containing protein n=1 Tax=Alcaligenes xylosoxydans xylosoxydans TaxID=85698 RepID=A0A424W554_ALCXX|nr:hypothetical protein [Achromobacter xylosoxidans]MBC9904780.1 hypothetical protein [Achromobacter xylosoxidans]MBD0868697.1 hypothetical protein [Achromobacter xylosoxidans]QNP87800.1 hypothetical protein IAG39_09940 [Achromobacter xylosoxidans]RPJ88426.1 hypothetical protein DY367_27860 [Achromobacter xylosoxidans]